ncbi:hypothetical protein AVEN_24892-1 [Araneus ventricosus]|uniref:CCHC-type domain-containing protein n=1 Tax=Araneus ventricosus TaxID=182803 RepID=A0A4Y2QR18_ARAVE|nr:hypothetical protein AVEN_24892-1 [Araneus ventricosus]
MGPLKDIPLSGQQTCETYLTFFILKRISAENENFHTVSPFLVEEAISGSVGVVKSIRKLRSGDLLIEVSSRKQANQIMKLKALSKIPVSVSPHRSLNFSKGVISNGVLFNDETDVILNKLSSQGVTEVRRITIKKDGVILKTKHLVLTFRSSKLPQFIKAGYIRYAIRPYIPNPLRCFQCQRLGHAKASCRGTLTCARCAELGHDNTDCKRKEKCVNCKGEHSSFSRLCPKWQLEKEIISLKIKKGISYPEAKKLVQSRTPTPGISYASASKATKKSSNLTLLFDTSSESDHINKPDSMTVEFLPVPNPETLPPHANALISELASGDPRTPASPDFETVIKEKHNESKPKRGIDTSTNSKFLKNCPTNDVVINQPDTDSFKDFPSKPVSTPCDSPDLSGFTTVKKKKKRKNKSTSIKEKNKGDNADQQSKFWTTSPRHISNTDSMQVDESAISLQQVNTTTIFDNSVKLPSSTSNSEAIPIVSSEKDDAIDYDPHETIEDMPPVIEQQQQQQTSTDATCPETATLKRQLKKCHFRLVDFKTFYNEPLSTPVHDKYLKKHQVKRLQ